MLCKTKYFDHAIIYPNYQVVANMLLILIFQILRIPNQYHYMQDILLLIVIMVTVVIVTHCNYTIKHVTRIENTPHKQSFSPF